MVWNSSIWLFLGKAVTTGESLLLILLPILFAVIGLGLLYYTACLFFNKSWIDIEGGMLKISHRPIPWWKGNKSLEIDQINQVYVKEKISKSKKGGITYYYHLRAKLQDGEDVLLFDIDETESTEVLLLESKIEDYLGIRDRPVKGEYSSISKNKESDIAEPRELLINRDTLLEIEDQIKIGKRKFQVIHKSQYDWNNGNSDCQFQILDESNLAKIIAIEQNKGLFEYYLKDELNILVTKGFNFNDVEPPSNIMHKSETFHLLKISEGNQFRSDLSEPIQSKKWSYKSKNGSVLSIIKDKGMFTYYIGNQLDKDSIVRLNDGLELKPLKEN